MKQFENKVVIVTGGGLGIGQTTALEFAKEGATVIVANRNKTEGQGTVDQILDIGGTGMFIPTDVTKETDVKNLVSLTLNKYGRIDCAFNNAGIEQVPMPLIDQNEEMFDRIMNVNVKGVWLCMKYEIEAMLKNGGGSIVNASSFSGVIAFATIPLYVASKHAVVGLTKSVALEFAKKNIRVNAVLPGAVENTGTLERSFGGDQDD